MSHTPPPNWVKSRADCNLSLCFDSLREIVSRDVEEMNKLSKEQRREFHYVISGGTGVADVFQVDQKDDDALHRSWDTRVHFARRRDLGAESIEISRVGQSSGKETKVVVRAQWDSEQSRCRLLIDDAEIEVWQISKKALEPMFFG